MSTVDPEARHGHKLRARTFDVTRPMSLRVRRGRGAGRGLTVVGSTRHSASASPWPPLLSGSQGSRALESGMVQRGGEGWPIRHLDGSDPNNARTTAAGALGCCRRPYDEGILPAPNRHRTQTRSRYDRGVIGWRIPACRAEPYGLKPRRHGVGLVSLSGCQTLSPPG
jgi:hypothetical protein